MEAVALVKNGMVVGLGTGSTAASAIDSLIAPVRNGLRIPADPALPARALNAP